MTHKPLTPGARYLPTAVVPRVPLTQRLREPIDSLRPNAPSILTEALERIEQLTVERDRAQADYAELLTEHDKLRNTVFTFEPTSGPFTEEQRDYIERLVGKAVEGIKVAKIEPAPVVKPYQLLRKATGTDAAAVDYYETYKEAIAEGLFWNWSGPKGLRSFEVTYEGPKGGAGR